MSVSPAIKADKPAPLQDFKITSANGNYDFVMLPTQGRKPESYEYGGINRDPALRNAYRSSGLYPRGSKSPLWTIDWNAFSVLVSDDGHHVARMGPWPLKDHVDELAINFYEDGREIKSWSVKDLFGEQSGCFPQTISHYQWLDEGQHLKGSAESPGMAEIIELRTTLNQTLLFDLATGQKLEDLKEPPPFNCGTHGPREAKKKAPDTMEKEQSPPTLQEKQHFWLLAFITAGIVVVLLDSWKDQKRKGDDA